jgi:hypothetical protein
MQTGSAHHGAVARELTVEIDDVHRAQITFDALDMETGSTMGPSVRVRDLVGCSTPGSQSVAAVLLASTSSTVTVRFCWSSSTLGPAASEALQSRDER